MATIVTRDTGATAVNRPLTNAELDANFINLNNAIISGGGSSGGTGTTITVGNVDGGTPSSTYAGNTNIDGGTPTSTYTYTDFKVGTSTVIVSDTPPSNAVAGTIWFNSNTLLTYVYYNDGDSSQWVNSASVSAGSLLPTQTGNSGKYLATDGSNPSWSTVSVASAQPKITSVIITDSSYTTIDDTALSTSGGYIKIIGTGFTAGSQVMVNTTTASSVSFISSTELRAQVPATAAGTYVVYVVATDGSVAIKVNGVTFSATPTWTTSSTLTSGVIDSAISIQLNASSDTTVIYSVASGSTLPTGLSLSSSGLLSGTVTGISVDTTYNFTVNAVDAELQDSPRAFTITISGRDLYFNSVPLLLKTNANNIRSTTVVDSAATPNTATKTGNPSTGWISPYQTTGYWSGYFPGSASDYISVPNGTAVDLTGGTYTVEAWVYPTARTATYSSWIVGKRNTTSPYDWAWSLGIGSTGLPGFSGTGGGASSASIVAPLNAWTHLAAVSVSNSVSFYVNGVLAGGPTAMTVSATTAAVTIGNYPVDNPFFSGYISNIRIVKGVAVYTGAFTPPTTPLTATQSAGTNIAAITGSATTLLCLQDNKFKDNAPTPSTITVSGSAQVTPYYYPSGFTAPTSSLGAMYINAADRLDIPTTTAFSFGTGDFTVEGWVYTSAANLAMFDARSGVTATPWVLNIGTGTNTYWYDGTSYTSTIVPVLNTWNHIAVSRTSGVLKIFVNGVQGYSAAYTTNLDRTAGLRIADVLQGGGTWTAYLGQLRIVKGTGVYTGAFTPPSGPLTQTGGTYPSTTNVNTSIPAANTVLLLNLSESNYTSVTNAVQNNIFLDSSGYSWPITRVGTPTQGAFTPYQPSGYWSGYFAGSANYLSLASNAAFALGTGNFCIEFWIYPVASWATQGPVLTVAASGGLWVGRNAGNFVLRAYGVADLLTTATSPTTNTWTHVAIMRSGTTASMYFNGTRVATGTVNQNFTQANFLIGTDGGTDYMPSGYLSNLRLVNGSAVYDPTQTTITVPTTPLTAITNTSLLILQSNRFRDNSANNFTITTNGTPSIQAFQPFPPAAFYNAQTYGASGYFGTTDYLTLPNNAAFTVGTGNFTLEGWFYLTTFNTQYNFMFQMYDGTNDVSLRIGSSGAGSRVEATFGPAVVGSVYSNASYPSSAMLNQWVHLALCKNGDSTTFYYNGAVVQTRTGTSAISFGTPTNVNINYPSPNYFLGYISNLRFVKGTALYTTAFTPPAVPVTAVTGTSLLANFANAGIYDAAWQNTVSIIGDTQVSTTQKQWGTTSIKFDGAIDSLTIPSSTAFGLGTGDWTIEFWVYLNATTTQNLLSMATTSGVGSVPHLYYSGGSGIRYYVSAADRITGGALNANTWYYISLVKSSGSTKLYINGVQTGSTYTDTNNYGTTNPVFIGDYSVPLTGASTLNGYIQDVRITKGVARTVTTIPTSAFIGK